MFQTVKNWKNLISNCNQVFQVNPLAPSRKNVRCVSVSPVQRHFTLKMTSTIDHDSSAGANFKMGDAGEDRVGDVLCLDHALERRRFCPRFHRARYPEMAKPPSIDGIEGMIK